MTDTLLESPASSRPTEALLNPLRSGVCTYLGLPLHLDPMATTGVVLGAPFDGGVLHRAGARMGPWAIRQASLGLGHLTMPLRLRTTGTTPSRPLAAGWVDGGNIPTRPLALEEALFSVEQLTAGWAALGTRTFLLGGDHLMTLGALRAHHRVHGPLGLLHLDAHPDAGHAEAWGGTHHHGTWLRQALEEGLLDPKRVLIAGLRAPRWDDGELGFLADAGASLWTPWDLRDPRLGSQLQGDIARVGQGPAYVTLDLDVMDPAFCPAVAEPVPGGLSVHDTLSVLQHLRQWSQPWVGADVMELAATLPGGEDSARIAAHLGLHLLTVHA